MSDQLLDIEAAAERLGVSTRWMRRAIAERRIRFAKIGKHVRFRAADLDAFVEANLHEASV